MFQIKYVHWPKRRRKKIVLQPYVSRKLIFQKIMLSSEKMENFPFMKKNLTFSELYSIIVPAKNS